MRRLLFFGSCLCLLMTSPAHSFELLDDLLGSKSYALEIHSDDEELRKWLKELKLDSTAATHKFESSYELGIEADRIVSNTKKALAAKGYYQSAVTHEINEDEAPPLFDITIEPGPQYTVSAVKPEWKGSLQALPEGVELGGPHAGDAVDAEEIRKTVSVLTADLFKKECLLDLTVKPELGLNHEDHTATLYYVIDAGQPANFGATTLEGNETVNDETVREKIKWKQGECYDKSKVLKTERSLLKTKLFGSSNVTTAETPNEAGEVPMHINMKERAHRTISAGANYATDRGAGIKLGWEHRNFFGGAEQFNADTLISQEEQSLKGGLRIPTFLRDDQTLTFNGGFEREATDIYTSQEINAGSTLERQFTDELLGGIGVNYSLSHVEDTDGTQENFGLISFPGFVEYDNRTDLLDPKDGIFARYAVSPTFDTLGNGVFFVKHQLNGITYFGSSELPGEPVLALRGGLGSITGASLRDVPADRRFYAGGGGSVRGYSYQSLGPVENGEVAGGLSLIELAAEGRFKVTDTWGGVVFVDAGNAYEDNIPDLSNDLFYGAGAGVRYYSEYGVIRFDVAVPINDKGRESDAYNIYVSIGQAY